MGNSDVTFNGSAGSGTTNILFGTGGTLNLEMDGSYQAADASWASPFIVTNHNVRFGLGGGGSATMTINNGAKVFASGTTFVGGGNGTGGSYTMKVDGVGGTTFKTYHFDIGDQGSQATVNITNGAVVTSLYETAIGLNTTTPGAGTLTVDNSTLNVVGGQGFGAGLLVANIPGTGKTDTGT